LGSYYSSTLLGTRYKNSVMNMLTQITTQPSDGWYKNSENQKSLMLRPLHSSWNWTSSPSKQFSCFIHLPLNFLSLTESTYSYEHSQIKLRSELTHKLLQSESDSSPFWNQDEYPQPHKRLAVTDTKLIVNSLSLFHILQPSEKINYN
jgi:hypothetical protein